MNADASIGLAALGGMLTVLSPCVLPILPILIGRSLQSHRYGPIALVAGLVTGFAAVGSLLGITASWLAEFVTVSRNGAIAVLLTLGLCAIFPNWSYRVFHWLPIHQWAKPFARVGLLGEFCLGTQLGLLWTPCAGPVLGSILVLAAVHQAVSQAFVLLFAYGVGAAVPLLAIAYGGRAASHRLQILKGRSTLLQRVGGVAVAATAIAILLGWDVQIQLWLAPLLPNLLL